MGKHFSFIHCADLHLGEPFGGVRLGTKGPWNEQIGKATFKAFEKVVDAAAAFFNPMTSAMRKKMSVLS